MKYLSVLTVLLFSVFAYAGSPFLVYDCTWGTTDHPKPTTMPAGVSSILWGHVSLYNRGGSGPTTRSVADFADALQRSETKWPAWPPGTFRDLSVKSLTAFDVEGQGGSDPAVISTWFKTFREHAPGVRITSYGEPIGGWGSREQLINPSVEDKIRFAEYRKPRADIVASMDAICPDVYMLGPKYADRDIKYIAAVLKYCHTYYPDKPVYLWTWGAYHTAWNPPHSLLAPDVLSKYVAAIRKGDGAVAWGEWEDNEQILLKLVGK
jgi:hypothetical protein